MPIFFKIQTFQLDNNLYNFRKEVLTAYSKSKSIKDIDEKYSLSPLLSRILCIAIYNSEKDEKLLLDGDEKNILSLFTKYIVDNPNTALVSFNGISFDFNYILVRLLLNSTFEQNNISVIETLQKRLKWHLDIFQILKNTVYGDTSFPILYKMKFGDDLKYTWMTPEEFKNSSLANEMSYEDFLKKCAKEYVVALYNYCCLPENIEINLDFQDNKIKEQEVPTEIVAEKDTKNTDNDKKRKKSKSENNNENINDKQTSDINSIIEDIF